MSEETFVSGSNSYKITVYPAPVEGKKHPIVCCFTETSA